MTKGTEIKKHEQSEVAALAATPDSLLQMVAERGATPEEVEKWMALKERWDEKQAKKAYIKAMAEFQRRCPAIANTKPVKNKTGTLLYSYAPLSAIVSAVGKLESELGFSHRFNTEPQESGGARVSCIVTHIEGHSETTTVTIPATKGMNTNASQDHGIVIAYGQRYSYRGAFGLTTGIEDTDARTPPLTIEQVSVLQKAIEDGGVDLKTVLAHGQCDALEDFPQAEYERTLAQCQKRKAEHDAMQNQGPAIEQELI